ncbi:hypothetical protein [Aureibacillus halotolerans]|uniref:Alpha/beta hydrolase family protein n=1 Tax=Aureibacillus halotolerans TaxID=1508390 RepID=A0A4R6U4T5_9BACI|nr:hypothetical protein [Aureibacillus halotolerans]TDQ40726.1 hypothetical protein EV213_10572 [Aureibacillus halotolerans]
MKRKWVKRLGILALISAGGVILVGFLFRDDGTLSRFLSDEAETEFKEVYASAMNELPEPHTQQRIETTFGVVQMYGFGDVESTKTPLLLLPGKSASTPMWESNLADLMKERPVYTIDLLGEPGLSTVEKRMETRPFGYMR